MSKTLGKAYVQIIPSADGISGSIQKVIDPESSNAGKSGGKKFGGMFKKVVIAAGLGLVIKKSIEQGAQLEQSIGGIETLFKDSASEVIKHANDAFKTTGISANDYMENVTGFSASLLQSLGGDTKKAASVSNRAMIDMADNSNKMGTAMGDIQNAYQGFAKGNYTMLDNLKLGYGGTKTEMERLLKDAQKLSGVKYNIDNLADVYNAVGVVQDQLGITGTTALEAEETIAGSLSAMKASFTNVLGNLALGESIVPSITALAETMSTFIFGNFIPMVWNIVSALPEAIIAFFVTAVPLFLQQGTALITSFASGVSTSLPTMMLAVDTILTNMSTWINNHLPKILNSGVDLISTLATGLLNALPTVLLSSGNILNSLLNVLFDALPKLMDAGFLLITKMAQGLKENMPAIIDAIVKIVNNLLQTIVTRYPEYIKKGWEIIGKLAKGLWDNLPFIVSTLANLIARLISTIGSNLPKFISQGMLVIVQLGVGLIRAIPGLVAKIPQIVSAVVRGLTSIVSSASGIGKNIVQGLWNGISSVNDWIMGKVKGFVDGVMGGIKKFFGIKSPSREMADQVGKYLPSGIALGIETNTKPLTKTMEDLSAATVTSFDADFEMNGRNTITAIDKSSDDKLNSAIVLLEKLINKMDRTDQDENNFINSIVRAFALIINDMGIYLNEREIGKLILKIIKEKGLAI